MSFQTKYYTYQLLIILLLSMGPATAGENNHFKLIAVEDGDTITVQIGSEEKRLQLSGIDAPEDVVNPKLSKDIDRTGLPKEALLELGKTATKHLMQLISPGENLRIEGDLKSNDKYGRVPIQAYKEGGASLNEQMVADGYAVVLGRAVLPEPVKSQLLNSQRQAQTEQKGLWGTHPANTLLWSGQAPAR
jgi:micrococcal nuclease